MQTDYQRIVHAIQFLEQRRERQPTLEALAAELNLSPFHCQRLFQRWAGISPKRFLQILTVEHAKRLLRQSRSVLEVSLASGLSGPGRLYDHFITLEAITPGEYKLGGAGLGIRYGVHDSPFGPVFLATTPRGVCALSFLTGQSLEQEIEALAGHWPRATLEPDSAATGAVARRLFEPAAGGSGQPLRLLVRGSNFQVNVWKALLRIPPGAVCSYGQLAHALDRPQAARAVGQAVAANPIAYLIPCHRVIRASGLIDGYRWGTLRKKALLAWEDGHADQPVPPADAAVVASAG